MSENATGHCQVHGRLSHTAIAAAAATVWSTALALPSGALRHSIYVKRTMASLLEYASGIWPGIRQGVSDR